MPAPLPDHPHCPVVLACDTSQQACSVALALTNGDIIERLEETGRGHTEKLPLMIKDILASTGVGLQDVDRLGVTIGPGTFAGVRVGLAAMRAIRVSHHLPIYSITTTHALALGFEVGAHDEARPHIVAIDARRGELYSQIFDAQGAPISEAMVCTPEMLCEKIAAQDGVDRPVIIGSGAEILAAQIGADDIVCSDLPFWPQAGRIAEWVARQDALPENTLPPEPLYLRPPDAALPHETSFLTRQ